MKLGRFTYHAPATLDEAAELLVEKGPDAAVLAGGQSLLPVLALRLGEPDHLIDINRIAGLDGIVRANGHVAIGATARQHHALHSDQLASDCPLVPLALAHVGVRETRSRGTVVGSLAHADPAAELGAVAVALEAEIVLRRGGETRTLPASEFFVAPFTTARLPGELVTEVRLPVLPPEFGWAFLELPRGPFALVAAAAGVRLKDGRIADARLALAGAGPGPIRASAAEALLIGAAPEPDAFDAAVEAAVAEIDPQADTLASAATRRQVARALSRDALVRAAGEAGT